MDEARKDWNTHYIRRSRHNSQAGIPDRMYFLPESAGARIYKFAVEQEDIAAMHARLDDETPYDYETNFDEVCLFFTIPDRSLWSQDEAKQYFHRLMEIAR